MTMDHVSPSLFYLIVALCSGSFTLRNGDACAPSRGLRYELRGRFIQPLTDAQEVEINSLISALQAQPIVTQDPTREIFIESITYRTRVIAVCRFRISGPEFSRQEMTSIEGIAKSQVDILIDTNALATVDMVRI